ncbi:hypothetical protein CYMTET_34661 [Cymbomonas tetramitiformis]|uniref:Uncharacterized protein n=1 Tax=Cymbomonas tetramitiformis TaxID=36881 RepID=A0AAE0FAM4_9CHLO|nr:hypothetical protein CYMTET_34661 [Cymbomonas tetramitiformis]
MRLAGQGVLFSLLRLAGRGPHSLGHNDPCSCCASNPQERAVHHLANQDDDSAFDQPDCKGGDDLSHLYYNFNQERDDAIEGPLNTAREIISSPSPQRKKTIGRKTRSDAQEPVTQSEETITI